MPLEKVLTPQPPREVRPPIVAERVPRERTEVNIEGLQKAIEEALKEKEKINFMLSINDLKHGVIVVIDGSPYVVSEVKHLHMGRGGSSVQTKIKNLQTGQVFSRNFKPADNFEEAETEKIKSRFLYESKEIYWFNEIGNPKNRFSFKRGVGRWMR